MTLRFTRSRSGGRTTASDIGPKNTYRMNRDAMGISPFDDAKAASSRPEHDRMKNRLQRTTEKLPGCILRFLAVHDFDVTRKLCDCTEIQSYQNASLQKLYFHTRLEAKNGRGYSSTFSPYLSLLLDVRLRNDCGGHPAVSTRSPSILDLPQSKLHTLHIQGYPGSTQSYANR